MAKKGPVRFHLVASGKYHDINFARVELLKLLAEDQRYLATVSVDYADTASIAACDVLITYTCDVQPTADQTEALHQFLQRGGKWFALHGTNSVLRFVEGGVATPREAPRFMEMIGSQFIAHPPLQDFQVSVTPGEENHPLVKGIDTFTINDEIYCAEYYGENRVLLETHWHGKCDGFIEGDWTGGTGRHYMLYTKQQGAGEVVYCALGPCRGKYDMIPIMDEWPTVDRCAWDQPVFYEILRRGIRYCAGDLA